MQGNGDVKVLIAEIKGTINVVLTRVDALVKSVDSLASNTVTKEELKLTLEPLDNRIVRAEKAVSAAMWVVGMIAFGVLGMVLAQTIPGFKL